MAQNYLTIKNVLDTFAANHDELKRFKVSFREQLDNFSTEEKEFPILFSEIQDLAFAESEDIYTYRIYCLDILQKDRSNHDTVLNTTSTILSDLTNWLRRNYEAPVVLLNEPRAFPVNNYLVDFTSGFYADFEFEVVGEKSDCKIPFSNFPQFSGTTCDVTYNKPWLTCATLPNCSYYIDLVNNSIVTNSLSAATLSGGTIYSGSTDLSNIFGSGSNILLGKNSAVYLFGNANDAAAAGGAANNAFTTFQSAYDRANLIATTASTQVLLSVLNCLSANTGNLVLTGDYNTNVRIEGYSFNTSNLGNIISSATTGNSFNVGGALLGQPVYFSNVTLGNIITRAGNSSGNSGRVNIALNSVNMMNIDTSIPSASWTGNGGSVLIGGTGGILNQSNAVTVGTVGNITTRARTTSASAGTVTISAPNYNFGTITTASSNLGGAVVIGNASNILTVSVTSNSSLNNSIQNVKNIVTSTISCTGGTQTFTNVNFTTSLTISNVVGAKTVNLTNCYIPSIFTATSGSSCTLNNVYCGQINGMGGSSTISNSNITGFLTFLVGGTNLGCYNSSLGTQISMNNSQISVYNCSGALITSAGANSTVQNSSIYSSIEFNGNNSTLYNTTTATLTYTSAVTTDNAFVYNCGITSVNIPTGRTVYYQNAYVNTVIGGRYINLEQDIAKTSVSATTLSAETIYSGSTDLYDIFQKTGQSSTSTLNPTQVGFGNSLSGLTGSTGMTFNGNKLALSGTLSDNVFLQIGSNMLFYDRYNGFAARNGAIIGGISINNAPGSSYIAGTTGDVNLTNAYGAFNVTSSTGFKVTTGGLISNSLSATTFSAGTLSIASNSTLTQINANSNTFSLSRGGIVGLSLNDSNYTDLSQSNGVRITGRVKIGGGANPAYPLDVIGRINSDSLSATTISATTFYSGSTDLSLLFVPAGTIGGASTYVQPGLNTYTGGTSQFPTVNISAATLTSLSSASITTPSVGVGKIAYVNSLSAFTGTTDLVFDNTLGSGTISRLQVGDSTGYGQLDLNGFGENIRIEVGTDSYFTTTNGGFVFRPAFVEKMRLTSTGLGIGKTPTQLLDVGGRTNTNELSATTLSATTSIFNESIFTKKIKKTSVNYTADTTDYIILATMSGITITMPLSSSNNGRNLIVKNVSLSSVTISAQGGDQIDLSSTYNLSSLSFAHLVTDTSGAWYVI